MPDKLFMPTHPSSPFSHAHTRTHHQPDSSPSGLAQWTCYKGLNAWVQSRLDPCANDTYIHTQHRRAYSTRQPRPLMLLLLLLMLLFAIFKAFSAIFFFQCSSRLVWVL